MGNIIMKLHIAMMQFVADRNVRKNEGGFTTAELLGNAALGIVALVAIWLLLQQLGVDIINWIRGELL